MTLDVKKTEGAKISGDRIQFLLWTLPMAVRDLIDPEVCSGHVLYKSYFTHIPDSQLYRLPLTVVQKYY
jgi:hypothetical protein